MHYQKKPTGRAQTAGSIVNSFSPGPSPWEWGCLVKGKWKEGPVSGSGFSYFWSSRSVKNIPRRFKLLRNLWNLTHPQFIRLSEKGGSILRRGFVLSYFIYLELSFELLLFFIQSLWKENQLSDFLCKLGVCPTEPSRRNKPGWWCLGWGGPVMEGKK